ncbi:MAG: NTP transferase domain-containing protein [Deltaproteobacteria bacterium]|nr:NTP transferase domain-containing protein [Deltaproteobacteria bacterium]
MANSRERAHEAVEGPTAVILCGGLGTRLRSLFPDRPKALVPVAGRPFLAWQLDWLRSRGVGRVLLAAGHGASQLSQWRNHNASEFDLEIDVVIEPEPLGTAGALRWALPRLKSETFLALNGDTLLPNLDLSQLSPCTEIAGFGSRDSEVATLAAVSVPAKGSQGRLKLDGENRVAQFLDPNPGQASSSGWVNGGVYRLSKALLEGFPKARSLEREVFPELAIQGRLRAARTLPPLLDMGTPTGLDLLESFLGENKTDPPSPFSR